MPETPDLDAIRARAATLTRDCDCGCQDRRVLLAEVERLREALAQSEGEREDLDTGVGTLLGENVELAAQVERLRRWKAEGMTLFDGLQDLGRALGVPLGVLITGPVAVEAARDLLARADAAEARLAALRQAVEALADEWDALTKGESPTTGRLRALLAAEHGDTAGGEDRG